MLWTRRRICRGLRGLERPKAPDAKSHRALNPGWCCADTVDEATHMPEDCEDFEAACKEWASAGECTKNVGYMVGDASTFGACRKACDVCEPCAPGDKPCRAKNRLRAGFPSLEDMA